MENTSLIPVQLKEVSEKLNTSVMSVLNAQTINGFEKAYTIATAIDILKKTLTPEYMKPIMALQGNRLGFKTDKDKDGGYPESVVKNCLVEAVLIGLKPFGNEFNIIAGNMYATKEGCGSLLKGINGLVYDITPSLPRIDTAKGSSAILMKIRWSLNSEEVHEKEIDFAIKVNQFMGTDAVIGKATRKARKWLYDTLTGFELPEGDVSDTHAAMATSVSLEDLKELFEIKRENLSAEFIANAERILKNQETKSYSKLFNELKKA